MLIFKVMKMKRYNINSEPVESPSGEWIMYNSIFELKSRIRCLEQTLESVKRLPTEYNYLLDKYFDDMTEIEKQIILEASRGPKSET